jgi:hypothetical protein
MTTEQYILGVVWPPEDEKAYWYGPVNGEDERWAGEVVLRELWQDKFEAGTVELVVLPVLGFPWQQTPTNVRRWGSSTTRSDAT